MRKHYAILLLMALLSPGTKADFSGAQAVLHPRFPGSNPFIIEITGTWPTDCHPGEQKPVVESFDGHRAEIGFETIVVHITCNFKDTDYRVLVDMSEAVRKTKPQGGMLDIGVSFGDAVFQQSLDLACQQGVDCENAWRNSQQLESGIYYTPGLDNQGLLVARQNASTSIFPLVYDESGRSEWLFTGNRIVENSFFTEILRPGGGDCFGCTPTYPQLEMTPVGYLSALVDAPGVLQVKVNDGLFTQFRRLVFGYDTFAVGPDGQQTLIDLAGRWAVSENRGTDPPLGDLTGFLPGAFDITLEEVVHAGSGGAADGQVTYSVSTLTGETLGQLVCDGQTGIDGFTDVCMFIDPADAAEPLFLFYQEGPSSLSIEYGRPLIAVGIAPGGKAVRLE